MRSNIIAYQAYPPALQGPVPLYRPGEVLLAVKYPRLRELYREGDSEVSLQRVFFQQPYGMLSFSDRRELYDLITFSDSLQTYILNERGIEHSERGLKCFCFIDHLNRPQEYLLVEPTHYVTFTCEPGLPISIQELSNAIDDLESLAEIADMYECTPDSVLQRVRQFNRSDPPRPLYPPEDYMQRLAEAVLERRCSPAVAADKLGLRPHELLNWWFWSGK